MIYYPEIGDTFLNIRQKEFASDEDAISYYKEKYGSKLEAVILYNDPEIKVVWEK